MGRPKLYGETLPPGSVGSRQVPAMPTSKAASPPIQLDRWFRNGMHPNAQALNLLNEAANQAALFRTKEVFRAIGPLGIGIGGMPGSVASLDRWRFAFHTGPYTHAVMAIVMIASPSASWANDTYAKLQLYTDTAEATPAGSAEFHYGPGPNGTTQADGFQYLKPIMQYIDVDPDTDYYGKISQHYSRIQSACVFELPSLTENFGGYLAQNVSVMTPVLDVFREKLALLTRAVWRRGAATVLNWTCDDQTNPPTTTSASGTTNILDGSAAPSASTAGYTLAMNNKDRLSESSGVPVIMKAFGRKTLGTPDGTVYIKDSGGSTVASIANAFNNTPSWQSVTFNLPASTAKYDLMRSCANGSGVFEVFAVSMWEHHT